MVNDQVFSAVVDFVSSKPLSMGTVLRAAAMAAFHSPAGALTTQPVLGVMITVTVCPSAADVTVFSPTLNVIVPCASASVAFVRA